LNTLNTRAILTVFKLDGSLAQAVFLRKSQPTSAAYCAHYNSSRFLVALKE